MSLNSYKNQYQQLMAEPMSDVQRDIYLTQLMLEIEQTYHIGLANGHAIGDAIDPEVLDLYQRLSSSRVTV